MRISLAQLESRLGDIEANLESAHRAITTAVDESADLIVFPELFLSGYAIGRWMPTCPCDPRTRGSRGWRAPPARAALPSASWSRVRPDRTLNNSTVYYEDGRLVHLHRKLYLPTYSPFEERNHFTPGPRLRAFDARPDTRMAVLCCNDAWQPQLAFLATQDGAQLLLVPTASSQSIFPDRYDSYEYWHDITRFHGRMFQLFVVFVNRVGVEGQFHFWGGSHVVDPWGNVVAEAAQHEAQILTVDIDLGGDL